MNNSKLYSILEHFDKYEQNRCRKYIISPYFNKNQALIDLYDVLIKNINSARSKELTREMIWKKIHQDKRFDDVRCRKYLSDLLKLIEGYLYQQNFEVKSLQKANNLMEAVGERKIEELYSSTMRTAKRYLKLSPYRSANYYFSTYQVEKNLYDLTESEMHREGRANFEEMLENLDYFYFAEKLRIYCSILIRKRFSSHDYKVEFIKEIIEQVSRNKDNHPPLVSIYFQVYLTLVDSVESKDDTEYFKLKDLLSSYSLNFPLDEAYQLYTYAMNYCIKKINRGDSLFLQELFELYKELIEKKILFKEGKLSPFDFQNVVPVALRLGKYNWTESFINNYKGFLPEEYRDNAVSYNLARVHFYEKKYDKVIELLSEVEYDEYSYNVGSKVLLMATYYEINEVEPLYFLFESFRAYLNRHKDIPLQRRNNYKNLIKFTKKLMKIVPGDNEAVTKLQNEVANTRGIANAEWLKEKIAELEK